VEKTGITPTIKGKERVWWLGEMSRAGARDSSLFFLAQLRAFSSIQAPKQAIFWCWTV
jgi:hypothetical protein